MSVRTEVVMGTLVTIHVVRDSDAVSTAIDNAFGWFHEIEQRCSRFNPASELMQLSTRVGEPVPVSELLFEALRFALMVAEETDGAFDPTIGDQMVSRGFNREHRTGNTIAATATDEENVSWKDIDLDPDQMTVTLKRALTLDLGAVAKGLAIDTAAQELKPHENFAIDAGGDLYLGGSNPKGELWCVGIRHPRRDGEVIDSLLVSDQAVCTSGDYERRISDNEHHILDPRAGTSPRAVVSATVVAPGAMLADSLATAAFVLGPEPGIQLLNRMGVAGLIFTPDLERYETEGLRCAA